MHTLVPSTTLAAALIVAAPAAAQVSSVRYVAATPLVTNAGGATATLPAGTDLTPQTTRLSVAAPAAQGLGGAVSSFAFRHDAAVGTSLQITESSNVATPGLQASVGPHTTLLTLFANAPAAATVVLRHSASALNQATARHLVRIDVGDDGSFELVAGFGAQSTVSVPVVLTAAGLAVRIHTDNAVRYPLTGGQRTQAFSNVQIDVTPQSRCTVTGGQGGCAFALVPMLRGEMTYAGSLRLTGTLLRPNAPVVTGIGVAQSPVSLPGGLCTYNVVPLVALPGRSDGNGEIVLDLPVPPTARGSVHFQQLLHDPAAFPSLMSTPVVTLTCP